jgi:serine/threonine-protein kinase
VLGNTYRIVRRIAVGGMGRVYEAEHVRLPQRFAVKVIHEAQAHRPESVQRFEREALETSRLKSPHVVDVVDLLRTKDSRPCIVSEYLEGENLQERLDRIGKMEVDTALSVAIEICRGLMAAHERNVVHRDLKPSNVFLVPPAAGDREMVKLVDFGVAKVQDERNLTQTGAFVGTPAYMAPEQAAGSNELDHRADLYGVGAVLYHMLSGEPPYGREDQAATLMKLMQGEPPRVRAVAGNIPASLESIIERAMAREPTARYPSAAELCSELVAVAQGRGGQRVGALSTGREPSERRARWLRPAALAWTLLTSLILSAWLAAFATEVVFAAVEPSALTEMHRSLLRFGPVGVGGLALGLGLRRVFGSWRSSPKIGDFVGALRLSLLWGLGAFAAGLLGLMAWRAWGLKEQAIPHSEHAAVLGAAALFALGAFLISELRRQR